MNISKPNTFASSSNSGVSSVFFNQMIKHLVLIIPTILLLAQVIVGYLVPSDVNTKMAWLTIFGFGTIVVWRKPGFIGACAALVCLMAWKWPQLDPIRWHVLHAISLAGCWLVTYLCSVEETSVTLQQQALLDEKHQEVLLLKTAQQTEKQAWSEQRQVLQEELQRLKEEASHRLIEQEKQAKHLNLAKTEIELLTSQKQEILMQAQRLKDEALQLFEEADKKQMAMQQQLLEKPLESTIQAVDIHVIENEKSLLEEQLSTERQKAEELTTQLKIYKTQLQQLEQDYQKQAANLSDVATLKQQLLTEEMKAQTLAKQLETLQITQVEATYDILPQWEKKVAKVEGMYKQLRTQFEEKSRVLDQTRQQLFKVEGALEAVHLEQRNQELDGGEQAMQVHILVEGLNSLEQELSDLTNQVIQLEQLVSCLMAS